MTKRLLTVLTLLTLVLFLLSGALPGGPAGTYLATAAADGDDDDNDDNGGKGKPEVEYIFIERDPVETSATGPVLLLRDAVCDPEVVEAGDEVTVSLTLYNTGDKTAKSIRVTLDGLDNDSFTPTGGMDTRVVDSLGTRARTKVQYTLKASEKMTDGSYALNVRTSYRDEKQGSYADDFRVFIPVKGAGRAADVTIENVAVTPQRIKANDSFSLSFMVRNKGKSKAEDIKVAVRSDEGIYSKSPDIQMLDSLNAGQSRAVDFRLFAGDEPEPKNYNLQISLEYTDPAKQEPVTVNQYTGVYIDAGSGKLTPKIIINSYSFDPVVVRAGEKFRLDVSFLNTSGDRSIKNIKVYLTGIDADKEGKIVFTPVGGSNTFYIDAIAPKGVSGKSLVMYTIPDAEPQTYTVTANFEYQDEDGKEYEATELIGIPVIQQSGISIGEIALPPEGFVGEPVPLSLEFYNTGKTKLGNVMVRVEGDFEVQEKQFYVGNFEAGSTDYFETMLIPTQPGELAGQLIFTYDDPSGEAQEYAREFSLNVMEQPPMDPDMMAPDEMGEGPGLVGRIAENKFLFIGLAAAVAAAITVVIRRRRKQSQEFDE